MCKREGGAVPILANVQKGGSVAARTALSRSESNGSTLARYVLHALDSNAKHTTAEQKIQQRQQHTKIQVYM